MRTQTQGSKTTRQSTAKGRPPQQALEPEIEAPQQDNKSVKQTLDKSRLNQASDGRRQGVSKNEQFARSLGWLSIALGLAEIAAPRRLAKQIDVGHHPILFRMLGVREIASGIGILSQRKPAGGVWSRVGGNAMDLALLGTAFTSGKADRGKLMAAAATVAGVTALDVLCSQKLSRDISPDGT